MPHDELILIDDFDKENENYSDNSISTSKSGTFFDVLFNNLNSLAVGDSIKKDLYENLREVINYLQSNNIEVDEQKIKEIKATLNRSNVNELDEVAKKLGLKKDDAVITMITTLIFELNQFTNDFSFGNHKYIFKMLKSLSEYQNIKDENILELLKLLKNTLSDIITVTINEGEPSVKVLYKIDDKLKSIYVKYRQAYVKHLRYAKRKTDALNDCYNLLHHFTFEVSDFENAEKILLAAPELATYYSNDSDYFEKIFTLYINEFYQGESNYKILKYRKLLERMFISKSRSFTNNEKKVMLSSLSAAKARISSMKKTEIEKEQLFVLNEEFIKDLDSNYIMEIKTESSIKHKYQIRTKEDTFKLKKEVSEIDRVISGLHSHKGTYTNFLDKEVITMDSVVNMPEDACSLERLPNGGYLLGVYITDVTSFIEKGSVIEQTLLEKGETIYSGNKRLADMIPKELSNEVLALKEGVVRPVQAYMFKFTPSKALFDFEIKEALIKVKKNYTFSEIEKIYGNKDAFDSSLIEDLIAIASSLRKTTTGDQKELYHNLKPRTYEEIEMYSMVGMRVITELMVLVNHVVSKEFVKKGIPFIYRNNITKTDAEVSETINNLKPHIKENETAREVYDIANNVYVPSFYSTVNLGHSGLNLSAYGHITNPARSAASFINQGQIKKFLINGQKLSYDDELNEKIALSEYCDYLNERLMLNSDYRTEEYKYKRKQKKRA